MTEIAEISDRVPSGPLDCGSASSRFSSPGVPKSGSPAAAVQSSYTAACVGIGLCDSPRKPRQKPARDSNRERPCKRPAMSPRQRFPQSPCDSTSKSPSYSDRQSWTETRRISRPDSRPKSRREPRSEPPREPFPGRFPPWFPEGRFGRARMPLTYCPNVSYAALGSLGCANSCLRTVPQGLALKKPQIRASEADRRGCWS
jgi:hypothetical protein